MVDTVLYQDNKSTMLLEKNGRASSGKRTRHIDIRFYFVADRVKNGELRIEHCHTEEMVADYFTKPLQGIIFYKLRDQVMNIDSSSLYHSSQRSVLTGEDLEQTNPDIDLKEQQVTQPSVVRRRSYRDVVVATSSSNGEHHSVSGGSADHPATACAGP